jgi:hypothetical protein
MRTLLALAFALTLMAGTAASSSAAPTEQWYGYGWSYPTTGYGYSGYGGWGREYGLSGDWAPHTAWPSGLYTPAVVSVSTGYPTGSGRVDITTSTVVPTVNYRSLWGCYWSYYGYGC